MMNKCCMIKLCSPRCLQHGERFQQFKEDQWPQALHSLFAQSCRTADWLMVGLLQFLGWTSTHFEVVWDEELGRPEEVEDVAEHVSIPVNEVVLLQAVQDYRLRTIKETTNSTHREGRGGGFGRIQHVNIKNLCMERPVFSIHDTARQRHVQRDVTHSFSQTLKCFFPTPLHWHASSIHASTSKRDRKKGKKIKNRGGVKRSGPAGSWLPEAGSQSPSGCRLGATLRPPSLQMAHALWPSTAAVTSVIITKLLLSVYCIQHLFTAQILHKETCCDTTW